MKIKDNSTATTIDVLCPPDPSPQWPDRRTYEDIIKLHASNTEGDVINQQIGVFDFAQNLPASAIVIDIGAGKGALISDLRKIGRQKEAKYHLVAVSATELDAEHAKHADVIYYQFVPDHINLLKDYANQADFVIDTFGAATYATNPIHALIYSLLLLKPGATYTAISSLVPGFEDYSAFGDQNTQAVLVQFIEDHLELKIRIKPTFLKSKVKGNENAIVKDLLISGQRSKDCTKKYNVSLFDELSKQVDKLIGTPEVVSVWSDADFGKFQIRRMKYTQTCEAEKIVALGFLSKSSHKVKSTHREDVNLHF